MEKLLQLMGVSGYETQVAQYIYNQAKAFADEVEIDAMGNVVALKKGSAPQKRVMLIASMDQPGFIVTVKDGNILRFGGIGGVDASLVKGQVAEFASGAKGIIGSDADEDIKIKNLYVDMIEGSADIGDIFTPCDSPVINDKCITSGRLSARVGAYVLLKVLEQLKGNKNDVCFVFATHSELAYRGSKTASFAVDPDVAITVGTACATDVPCSDKNNITLDGGPAIKIKDKSILAHPYVKAALADSAQKLGIKHQAEISTETSEGGAVHMARGPVMTGGISIPVRYKGKQNELCLKESIENAVKMILGCELI